MGWEDVVEKREDAEFWRGYAMACDMIMRGRDPKAEMEAANLFLEIIFRQNARNKALEAVIDSAQRTLRTLANRHDDK